MKPAVVGCVQWWHLELFQERYKIMPTEGLASVVPSFYFGLSLLFYRLPDIMVLGPFWLLWAFLFLVLCAK